MEHAGVWVLAVIAAILVAEIATGRHRGIYSRNDWVVNGLCYVPFRWTVDTLGWQGTRAGVTVKSIVNRVRVAVSPGAIVLMHVGANPDDGSTLDADALARVIDVLRGEGYRLVRLSSVMRAAP